MLPNECYLTEADVVNAGLGLSRWDIRRAVQTGALDRVILPGRKHGKYRRADVMRTFKIDDTKGGANV